MTQDDFNKLFSAGDAGAAWAAVENEIAQQTADAMKQQADADTLTLIQQKADSDAALKVETDAAAAVQAQLDSAKAGLKQAQADLAASQAALASAATDAAAAAQKAIDDAMVAKAASDAALADLQTQLTTEAATANQALADKAASDAALADIKTQIATANAAELAAIQAFQQLTDLNQRIALQQAVVDADQKQLDDAKEALAALVAQKGP